MHTIRSDGTGTREDVARAAARAGVRVVVVADHGNAMRAADPPAYLEGVLLIDAVEVGTWGGHYVAIGAAPAPYPLGGEPRAVAEDVRRLGGLGIAAHPGSPKEDLRWRDWDARLDGVEWLNADSAWRGQSARLWRTALGYPWRPAAALTTLVERPAFELDQWDRLAARQSAVGLAAHDAHARLGLRGVGEPYDGWVALAVPDYAPLFASFTNVVRLPQALSGQAGPDADAVVEGLRAGRVYSVLTGLAPSGRLRFEAESGGRRATVGEHLIPQGPVQLNVEADVPPAARTVLVCGGVEVAAAAGGRLAWTSDGVPGACRAEIHVPWAGAERPWIVTNPIYVRPVLETAPPAEAPRPTRETPLPADRRTAAWTIEAAADAEATVTASPDATDAVQFAWRLGATPGSFAAMQLPTPADLATFDRLVMHASADRPMRVWVQLRVPGGEGQRWGRSVFLDATPRDVVVLFDSMLPFGRVDQARPPLPGVTALLVVADTVHALPGGGGRVTIGQLRLAR